MDLLGSEQEKQNNNGKKIILVLIMLSVLLLVGLLYLITVISAEQTPVPTSSFSIDGERIVISETLIFLDGENVYIGINELIGHLEDHIYYRGEYGSFAPDRDNEGHVRIRGRNEIIGFEGGSNEIYKTISNTVIDRAYFDLNRDVINVEDRLYMSIQDITVAFNIYVSYTINENETVELVMFTMDFMHEHFAELLYEHPEGVMLSNNAENRKTIPMGMLVVTRDGRYGIWTNELEEVVATIYDSIVFEEYTGNFVITVSNRSGIMDSDGRILVNPEHDTIRIINHSPLLYEVGRGTGNNRRFGIIRPDGTVLVQAIYERLGSLQRGEREAVLVIENIQNFQHGIVALRDRSYGIINLTTGREITPFDLIAIYARTTLATGEVRYYAEITAERYRAARRISKLRAWRLRSNKMKIILASNSPRRRELLSTIVKDFDIISSDAEEESSIKATIKNPEELVRKLALLKAQDVFKKEKLKYDDLIVIGGDTIVYMDGEVLGKPKTEENAFRMLNKLQGKENQVHTGMAVIVKKGKNIEEEIHNTSAIIKMKKMTEADIVEYIATKEPLDKAGGYAIQGIGVKFVEDIEGNYNAVVGLDTETLGKVLSIHQTQYIG